MKKFKSGTLQGRGGQGEGRLYIHAYILSAYLLYCLSEMVYYVVDFLDLSNQIREALNNPLVVGFINPDNVGLDMTTVKTKVEELAQDYQNVRFIFAVMDDTTDIGEHIQVDWSPFYVVFAAFFIFR